MNKCIILLAGMLNCKHPPSFAENFKSFIENFDDFEVVVHTWQHQYNYTKCFTKWFQTQFPTKKLHMYQETYSRFDCLIQRIADQNFVEKIKSHAQKHMIDSNDVTRRNLAIYFSISECYHYAKQQLSIDKDTFMVRARPNTPFQFNITNDNGQLVFDDFFSSKEEHPGHFAHELGARSPAQTKDNTIFANIDWYDSIQLVPRIRENFFGAFPGVWNKLFGYSSTETFLNEMLLPIYQKQFYQCESKAETAIFPSGAVIWGELFAINKLLIQTSMMVAGGQNRKTKMHTFY